MLKLVLSQFNCVIYEAASTISQQKEWKRGQKPLHPTEYFFYLKIVFGYSGEEGHIYIYIYIYIFQSDYLVV